METKRVSTGRIITVGCWSIIMTLLLLLSSTSGATTLVLSKPSFVNLSNKMNIKNNHYGIQQKKESYLMLQTLRGGSESDVEADASDDDTDVALEENDSESDDEEEQEEEESALIQATKQSLKKKKQQTQKQIKDTVSASLASSSIQEKKKNKKKKQASSTKQLSSFKIPYILKALLNPFTVIAMTKGYFASLFNIDYLQEDVSQSLRSALQEKAKHDPSGGRRKFTKKFKPGQAKTLSDLPQLNT